MICGTRPETRRPTNFRRFLLGALALWLACAAGCMTPAVNDSSRIGPFYTPANHVGDPQLPATMRRVLLLPIAGGSAATPESVAALDPVFLTELQKQNRFEIVTLTREECVRQFHVEEISSTAALPADFLRSARHEYAADGVLFVDLTVFKPYRPLVLGVRAKLAALGDEVHLVWTFDNVFSAADEAVANSARRHFLDSDRHGVPGDSTQSVLDSPSRFASYVAAQTFATLPRVYTPPPARPAAASGQTAPATNHR